MLRALQHVVGRAFLDHEAVLHHGDAIGDLGHHAEIVRDEQHRRALARLQLADEREDLRLRGHVERGRRLVGDQHARLERERHRDHGALALAAGELVRIGARGLPRIGNAHLLAAGRGRAPRSRPCESSVWMRNISPIWSPTVRSGLSAVIGSWKIMRDAGAAHLAHLGFAEPARGRGPRTATCAAVDRDALRQQPHHGIRHHRLAGAGLADHADDLVGVERQRHVLQRVRPVGARRQPHAQALERQDGAHRPFSLGFSASFSPWPTSETASTVTRIATPGMAETYHCTRSTSRPSPIRLPHEATFGSESLRKASALSSRIDDRHHDARIDDDRRQRVRQDLAEDEPGVAQAERAAGLHEFAVAQREELGARQPRRARATRRCRSRSSRS